MDVYLVVLCACRELLRRAARAKGDGGDVHI
jgi:hypothetical protein